MNFWKINCMEDKYPGMWQRWFKNQCVAVGWPVPNYSFEGKTKEIGWIAARNRLNEIKEGDFIVVSLKGNKIGRIGEVIKKFVEDKDWKPLVPKSKEWPEGQMGRRIHVRWDMTTGPEDRDLVIALPPSARFTNGELLPTVSKVRSRKLKHLQDVMNDARNWVGLTSAFSSEKSLSDYIAAYPHRLEDGLLPHPDKKVRERAFKNGKRLDVLLEDREEKPVIVECKQGEPTLSDLKQLRGYLKEFRVKERKKARGILVHGGARKLRGEVRRSAKKNPVIEMAQFSVAVDFLKSE